jgi:hypothetical protein
VTQEKRHGESGEILSSGHSLMRMESYVRLWDTGHSTTKQESITAIAMSRYHYYTLEVQRETGESITYAAPVEDA